MRFVFAVEKGRLRALAVSRGFHETCYASEKERIIVGTTKKLLVNNYTDAWNEWLLETPNYDNAKHTQKCSYYRF